MLYHFEVGILSAKKYDTFEQKSIEQSFYAGEETEANSTWPLLSVLKEMVNVELLLNPTFLLVGASNVFGMLGFYVPFVYLPNMAALRGVSVEDANFLLSVIGTVFFYAVS